MADRLGVRIVSEGTSQISCPWGNAMRQLVRLRTLDTVSFYMSVPSRILSPQNLATLCDFEDFSRMPASLARYAVSWPGLVQKGKLQHCQCTSTTSAYVHAAVVIVLPSCDGHRVAHQSTVFLEQGEATHLLVESHQSNFVCAAESWNATVSCKIETMTFP